MMSFQKQVKIVCKRRKLKINSINRIVLEMELLSV